MEDSRLIESPNSLSIEIGKLREILKINFEKIPVCENRNAFWNICSFCFSETAECYFSKRTHNNNQLSENFYINKEYGWEHQAKKSQKQFRLIRICTFLAIL